MKEFGTISKLIVMIAVALEPACAAEVDASETNGLPFVEAHVQASDRNSLVLDFSITNSSNINLIIDRADVPWMSYYALTMTATKTNRSGGGVTGGLPRKVRIADPPAGIIQIAPHDAITGSVALKRAFDNIEEALAVDDILINWSFQLTEGDVKKQFKGSLLIPSTSR